MGIDSIELTKNVIFVGDYFTLITTVVLKEELREPEESDADFAVRLASVWLQEHYGWDVAGASNEIGVDFEDEEDDEI